MNGFWTIAGAVLGAIVSALTVGIMVRSFLERYTRRVFADDVFVALKNESARYRDFHSEVFASELERGRRTSDIALNLAKDVQTLTENFSRFQTAYEGHTEQLILIPKTVIHLDETIKRLGGSIERVADVVHGTREEVARLKGVVEAISR